MYLEHYEWADGHFFVLLKKQTLIYDNKLNSLVHKVLLENFSSS